MKLTKETVTATKPKLPEGVTDRIFFDERLKGFGLRVRESGTKTWLYQYSLHNKTQRVKFGEYPAMTPAEAFEAARLLHAERHAGVNVAHVKAERQAAQETFGDVVAAYLAARESKLRTRTHEETARYLDKVAAPLHGKPLAMVTQADVAALLNKIAANSESSAGQLRGKLSALFTWAAEQGKKFHPDGNPVEHTARPDKSPVRERVLSDDELKAIWNALPDGDFGTIVKLLMLTGQRRQEIGGLRWAEINFAADEINLPAERTKNKHPHFVPMSTHVRDMLQAQPRLREHVFGRGDGIDGFAGWGAAKVALDARLPDMPDWTLHDLRRTVSTRLHDMGVAPHVVEAVINHRGHKSGVAGRYNHANYRPERRDALQRWADHVMALVTVRPFVVVASDTMKAAA
jgi:integrase